MNFGIVVDIEDNTDCRVVSMEALSAFTLEDYYEIPDGSLEDWITINPKVQDEVAGARSSECAIIIRRPQR